MKSHLPLRGATLLAATLACALCAAQDVNNASATQNGAGNRAYISQTENTEGVFVTVVQNGNNNVVGDPASQTGGVQQYQASDLFMTISQTGDANRATATQRSGQRTGFVLAQTGTANVTAVRQDEAYETVSRVTQAGVNNRVEGDAASTLTNGFTARQVGADHVLSVYNRNNGFSNSYTDQNGIANQIAIEQTAVGYTFHDIAQFGERNRVTALSNDALFTDYAITQNGTENIAITRTSAEASNGDLLQTGERNAATADQQGRNSAFSITQSGSFNTAQLAQNGTIATPDNNVATIRQNGQRLDATLAQTGSGNQGVINQR